jgi:hypothetical protein
VRINGIIRWKGTAWSNIDTYLIKRRREATSVHNIKIASANNELVHGGDGLGVVWIDNTTVANDLSGFAVGNHCDSKEGKDDGGEFHGEWQMILSKEKKEMEAAARWKRE